MALNPRQFYAGEWLAWSGRTQADIAQEIGMTQSHLSEVISGSARYNEGIILRLAKALNIPAWMLLYGPPSTALRAAALLDQFAPDKLDAAERAMRAVAEAKASMPFDPGLMTKPKKRRGRPRRS
jgi:transcriptional regulator with XRE-family HTH domain